MSSLQQKLEKLTGTQQNILQTSLWIMSRKSQYKESIHTLCNAIHKETDSLKLLNFMNLMNDVVQNSKKRTNFIIEEFQKTLPDLINHVKQHVSDKNRGKIKRILEIWKERKIYPFPYIMNLIKNLTTGITSQPIKKEKKEKKPHKSQNNSTIYRRASTPEGTPPFDISEHEQNARIQYFEEQKKDQIYIAIAKDQIGKIVLDYKIHEENLKRKNQHVAQFSKHMQQFENLVNHPDLASLSKQSEEYIKSYETFVKANNQFCENIELALEEKLEETQRATEAIKQMKEKQKQIKELEKLASSRKEEFKPTKRTFSQADIRSEDDVFFDSPIQKRKTDLLDSVLAVLKPNEDDEISLND